MAVKRLFDVLNEIPTDFVYPLYLNDSVIEVTPIRVGSFVTHHDDFDPVEVQELLPNGHYRTEMIDDGRSPIFAAEEVAIIFPEELPEYDIMWHFDPSLNHWLNQTGSLEKIADCGFRIYQHEKLGHLIGTDHDEPEKLAKCFELLYNVLELNWHLEDTYQLTQSTDTVASYFETKEMMTKALSEMPMFKLKNEMTEQLEQMNHEIDVYLSNAQLEIMLNRRDGVDVFSNVNGFFDDFEKELADLIEVSIQHAHGWHSADDMEVVAQTTCRIGDWFFATQELSDEVRFYQHRSNDEIIKLIDNDAIHQFKNYFSKAIHDYLPTYIEGKLQEQAQRTKDQEMIIKVQRSNFETNWNECIQYLEQVGKHPIVTVEDDMNNKIVAYKIGNDSIKVFFDRQEIVSQRKTSDGGISQMKFGQEELKQALFKDCLNPNWFKDFINQGFELAIKELPFHKRLTMKPIESFVAEKNNKEIAEVKLKQQKSQTMRR